MGREVSLFVITDGTAVSEPVTACDYKRQLDGDKGPNTGGMGCYSPADFLPEAREWELRDTIAVPIIETMAAMGCPYKGVLYVGLDDHWRGAEGPGVQRQARGPGGAGCASQAGVGTWWKSSMRW